MMKLRNKKLLTKEEYDLLRTSYDPVNIVIKDEVIEFTDKNKYTTFHTMNESKVESCGEPIFKKAPEFKVTAAKVDKEGNAEFELLYSNSAKITLSDDSITAPTEEDGILKFTGLDSLEEDKSVVVTTENDYGTTKTRITLRKFTPTCVCHVIDNESRFKKYKDILTELELTQEYSELVESNKLPGVLFLIDTKDPVCVFNPTTNFVESDVTDNKFYSFEQLGITSISELDGLGILPKERYDELKEYDTNLTSTDPIDDYYEELVEKELGIENNKDESDQDSHEDPESETEE